MCNHRNWELFVHQCSKCASRLSKLAIRVYSRYPQQYFNMQLSLTANVLFKLAFEKDTAKRIITATFCNMKHSRFLLG
jgi:hypothetical protein